MNKFLLTTLTATILTAGAAAQEMQAFPMSGERQVAGLFFWDGSASPGSFSVAYGAPEWKAEYEAMVESKKSGAVRLGKDAWTTLDTSVDLTIGGTKVPAGHYYLGVYRAEDGGFHLMCMDSATVRAAKKGPHETASLRAKINAPLKHTKADEEADELEIKVTPKGGNKGTFELCWGNHKLTANIECHLESNAAMPASAVKDAAKKGLEKLKK